MKKFLKILYLKLSGQWFKPCQSRLRGSWQPINGREDKVIEVSYDRDKVQKHCDKLNEINLNGKLFIRILWFICLVCAWLMSWWLVSLTN